MLDYNLNNIHEWPRPGKIIFIIIICGIVLYLAYYFDFSNLRSQLKTNQKLELDLKEQLTLLYKQQGEIGEGTAHSKEFEKALNSWQSKLVKQPQMSELLNEILKTGTASGIQFLAFTPGEEIIQSIYTKALVKAKVAGTYHQISNFISRIANMQTIVAITSFTINAPAKSTNPSANATTEPVSSNNLIAEINLALYYLNGNRNNAPTK